MGTRSLTKVYDQFSGDLICTMFRHFDGYPTGAGADIKKALKGILVVNGISGDEKEPFVNRMGKLVSFLIRNSNIDYEFIGGDSGDFIDFTYHLRFKSGRVHLTVDSYGDCIYEGMLDEFDPEKVESEQSESEG